MAASREGFSAEAVASFIREKGNKATTAEVARHFRKFLLDEDNQEKNKALFREYVNAVAVINRINNEKYLVLRPAFKYPSKNQEAVDYNEPKAVIVHEKSPVDSAIIKDDGRSLEKLRQDAQVVSSSETTDMTVETVAKDKNKSGIGGETLKETEYMETSDHHITTPVAPPRRKHSEKEKKSVPSLEINSQKISTAELDKESEPKLSVKEQAQKINKMASESQLVLSPHNTNVRKSQRDHGADKNVDDDDTASVISINASTKEWMVVAAKGEYFTMMKILKEDPRLAKYKDFTSGYTALHWAAKHGKADIVKLIAGTYKANVNIRSNGGYTPLHLAAMFNHTEVYELLLHYGAEKDLKDYNARKAEYYFRKHDSNRDPPDTYALASQRHMAHAKSKRPISVEGTPHGHNSVYKSSRGNLERKATRHQSFLKSFPKPQINRRHSKLDKSKKTPHFHHKAKDFDEKEELGSSSDTEN